MADSGPATLRMGSQGVSPAIEQPASTPKSGTRKKADTSGMTRGQKAAATRAKNKRAAERGASPKKATGMSGKTTRRPANWDQMTRGEKISYTRKANLRAAARSGNVNEKAAKAKPEKKKRKGKGKNKGHQEGHFEVTMSAEKAKKKLDQIRAEDPHLADAIEEEIEARARRQKLQGKKGKTAIIKSLAENHEPSSGDIVRPGSALGYALDGAIVIGTGLISNRLDEMISARPLGLAPSDILLIVETLVLGFGMWKKNRAVVRYSSLALTGTAGAKAIRRAIGGKSSPSP